MAGALSVAQSDAVSLLEELDYEDAGEWSANKLTSVLKKLKKEVEDPEEAEISKKNKKLLLAVVKAKNIELESEEADDEEEEEEAPKKKSAKKSGKASGSKTKVKTKEKDDFGTRLETGAAAINAAVIKAGKKGIEAAKLVDMFPKMRPGRVRSHIRWQEENGWTKVKDDRIFVK